jgi:DnaJ family protein C protein 28
MPADPSGYLGEPAPPWRIIAERKIQDWIEDGGAERLTNKGRKLDLTGNPFVPSDLRMAFDVLKNADAAPPWIEIGKEIEALLARAREEGRRFRDAQRQDRIALRAAGAEGAAELRARMTERARRFAEEHRARLRHVNLQIDRFNAYCPVGGMGRARLNVERELSALLSPAAA